MSKGNRLAAIALVVALVAPSACGGGGKHKSASPTTTNGATSTTSITPSSTTTTAGATSTTSAAPRGTTPTGGPVPAGFQTFSFSALSDSQWWLLGDVACSHRPCTSVVRTTDGGRTFVGLPAPLAPITNGISDPTNPDGVDQIRFADPQDAFAFGPTLWTTHDGAAHWHQVAMAGPVTNLEAGGGYVFAVVGGNLLRSSAGSDTWTRLSQSNLDAVLAVHGSDVVVIGEAGTGTSPAPVLVSHDSGAHFAATQKSPSVGLSCQFAEPVTSVIWAMCATGTEAGISRSTNGGVSFSGLNNPEQFVNSSTVAAASATVAVVMTQRSGGAALWLTSDGGQTFQPTGPTLAGANWVFGGFTDPSVGVVIASFSAASGRSTGTALYRTVDGGKVWSRVTI